jgi:hypothetical protein
VGECANRCGHQVRPTGPEDSVDPAEFPYVHDNGNPVCGIILTAEPELGHQFTPDWCVPPAALLRDWMDENHLSIRVLAATAAGRARRDETIPLIRQVLERGELTGQHAAVLAAGTGIPVRMWLALEHNYRAGLAAGLIDAGRDEAYR